MCWAISISFGPWRLSKSRALSCPVAEPFATHRYADEVINVGNAATEEEVADSLIRYAKTKSPKPALCFHADADLAHLRHHRDRLTAVCRMVLADNQHLDILRKSVV